jgi:hypothetical protein
MARPSGETFSGTRIRGFKGDEEDVGEEEEAAAVA